MKPISSLLARVAAALVAVASWSAAPSVVAEPLSDQDYAAQWVGRHPAAMASFEDWLKAYPTAARQLLEWDRDHAPRSQFFLGWVVKHPTEGIAGFTSAYPEWPVVEGLMRAERPAMEAFAAWVHANAPAASELAGRVGTLHLVEQIAYGELHLPILEAAPTTGPSPAEAH